MNLDDHDLERELASLVPRPPSPALEQRLAAALGSQPVVGRRAYRPQALMAAAAGLALAGLLMVALTRQTPKRPQPTDDRAAIADAALDASIPTVWAYHRALVDPDVDLNDLLDHHRRQALGPRTTESTEFPVSSFNTHAWRGEL
jgi:hypothetical protein